MGDGSGARGMAVESVSSKGQLRATAGYAEVGGSLVMSRNRNRR